VFLLHGVELLIQA